jgi:hypothetical protein
VSALSPVFAPARAIADAVLYEGYLLFPYTASAGKNRLRWQFGVVVPRAYAARETAEHAAQQTDVLLETSSGARVEIVVRFLHVESRSVERLEGERYVPVPELAVDGTSVLTFDEAGERERAFTFEVVAGTSVETPLDFDAERSTETLRDRSGTVVGRIVRERYALRGTLRVMWTAVPESASLVRLRVVLENDSDVVMAAVRSDVVRTAFVSTHLLLAAHDAKFLSPIDPPEPAASASASLENRHTWPVLVGDRLQDAQRANLLLSAPIVLGDFPAIAPQTDIDAHDGLEIDQLLTLGVLALSDAERAEARATDPRARAIVERAERFGQDRIERARAGTMFGVPNERSGLDPLEQLDVPALDCVYVNGTKIAKGSSVRVVPKGRADIWDTFLAGRRATVQAIHQDFEDRVYVALTADDDPASEYHEWYGRAFFYGPEEVEPWVECP